jgi:hypothetical protein
MYVSSMPTNGRQMDVDVSFKKALQTAVETAGEDAITVVPIPAATTSTVVFLPPFQYRSRTGGYSPPVRLLPTPDSYHSLIDTDNVTVVAALGGHA